MYAYGYRTYLRIQYSRSRIVIVTEEAKLEGKKKNTFFFFTLRVSLRSNIFHHFLFTIYLSHVSRTYVNSTECKNLPFQNELGANIARYTRKFYRRRVYERKKNNNCFLCLFFLVVVCVKIEKACTNSSQIQKFLERYSVWGFFRGRILLTTLYEILMNREIKGGKGLKDFDVCGRVENVTAGGRAENFFCTDNTRNSI